jgi:hypothetical protein
VSAPAARLDDEMVERVGHELIAVATRIARRLGYVSHADALDPRLRLMGR